MCSLASLLSVTALLPAPVQQPIAEFRGLGAGTANLGDLDGDGVEDFLAGDLLHGVSGRTLKTLFLHAYGLVAPWEPAELVQGAGDLDGDGIGDILLATRVISGAALLESGSPGREGSSFIEPLRLLYPSFPNLFVPGGSAVLGDVDGDGVTDFAAGWPDHSVSRCPGDSIRFWSGGSGGVGIVYSGASNLFIGETYGQAPNDALGGVVARLGDLDGDGKADVGFATRVVPASPTYFCSFWGGGYTQARSSVSGALLWEVQVAPRTMSALDDLDGDGVADVALGFPYHGWIELRSGRTGALLRTIDDSFLGSGLHLFGNQILAWPDADGDGLGDLVASAPQPVTSPIGVPGGPSSSGPGSVVFLSSASGKPISFLRGRATGQEFGGQLARLGDLTGDDRPELAVGSPRAAGGGLVQVFAPSPLAPGRAVPR